MSKVRLTNEQPTPRVFIERDAFDDMLCIARATNDEVAWFARVEDLGKGMFIISDVFLPKQQSNGATVEIEPDHLVEFAEEYITTYGAEAYNTLRCWGHSHGRMGVTPSHQDQKTVDQLCAAIKATFIAIRVNHKGDYEVDVAYANGITIENATAQVGWITEEKEKEWKAAVKERVTRISYQQHKKTHTAPPKSQQASKAAAQNWGSDEVWDPFDAMGTYEPTDNLSRIEYVSAQAQDEENAGRTEVITGIKRYPYEAAVPYLKRVERLLELEDSDD